MRLNLKANCPFQCILRFGVEVIYKHLNDTSPPINLTTCKYYYAVCALSALKVNTKIVIDCATAFPLCKPRKTSAVIAPERMKR